MQFSADWLGEYVELPESRKRLLERLYAVGLNVEGTEERGADLIVDLEITANRPDCMCHLGVARELAAATGKPLKRPAVRQPEAVLPETAAGVRIVLDDPVGCPRYAGVVVRGVTVGPSPEWLVERLAAVGVRSINNVVDITNYVLWEWGQPLHAFDLARLSGQTIVVRRASEGETLVTLDEESRSLTPEMLIIADESEPVALAGVMGGRESEVGPETEDLLIESAHFDRSLVRRCAKELGLHTDASHRFERGSDPEACLDAALRAAALIVELAGGEAESRVVDARGEVEEPPSGRLDLASLQSFAGAEIPAEFVEETLPALGFQLAREGEGEWTVRTPSWRVFDVETDARGEIYPAHLYEEVLRHFGYDAVAATLPEVHAPDAGSSGGFFRREMLRRFLTAAGLAETITYGFYSAQVDRTFPGLGKADGMPLDLANALSEQYDRMRRSLLPNLLDGARYNQRRGATSVRLFELGHVFSGGEAGEAEAVGLVLGGSHGTPWSRSLQLDLFDLKGVLDGLAAELGLSFTYYPAKISGFVAGAAAEIFVSDERVGYLGQPDDPELIFPLYAAELQGEVLRRGRPVKVSAPSKFPGVAVDLTLTHSIDVAWDALRRAIEERRPDDLVDFGLKDRYQGKGVPQGAVNTTLYFYYNAEDRSLSQDEVNERQQRLADELTQKFAWESSGG